MEIWLLGVAETGHFVLLQRLILLWEGKEKKLGSYSYYLLVKTCGLFIAFVHTHKHTHPNMLKNIHFKKSEIKADIIFLLLRR